MNERLHLRAEDAGDLATLSALVQDMAVRVADIGWDRPARRLLLLGNRFRNEAVRPSRVPALLRIDFAQEVRRRDWPEDPAAVLALLAIGTVDGAIDLLFAGGAVLRVAVECVDATLDDIGPPRAALRSPAHD